MTRHSTRKSQMGAALETSTPASKPCARGIATDKNYPHIPRRVSGYNLDQLLPGEDGRFNLARALVGTESTCVTILEAKVRLVYTYPQRVLLVLGYPSIYEA